MAQLTKHGWRKNPSEAASDGSADSRIKITVKGQKRKPLKAPRIKGQPYDPGTSSS